MKYDHLLVGPPAVAPGPTNRPNRPISGAMGPVFSSAPAISVCRRRLQLSFGADAISRVTRLLLCRQGERGNTIYVHGGSSGPILISFIHFKIYLIKRSIFEKHSSPMFSEFHLVFYIIFPNIFFLKFLNLNSKIHQFFNSVMSESTKFQKNRPHFLTLL
jgi:hypothetical protein